MWENNSTQVLKCMSCQIFSSVETSHKSIPDFSLSLWMCTTHQIESSGARHMRCGESCCCVQIYFLLHASMIFPLLLVRKRGEIFPLQFTEEVKENLFHFNHKHSVLTFHMCAYDASAWAFWFSCAILCELSQRYSQIFLTTYCRSILSCLFSVHCVQCVHREQPMG